MEDTSAEKQDCTLSVLYSRGRISCSTARAIAKNIEIPLAAMGELLNHLNIKVKQCELGCF
ncbi:MAG: hypothetical protein FVQ82_15475 [Planctomycetes bacterium]|nr:hypothetical protein [Planctomycetota bacterium]